MTDLDKAIVRAWSAAVGAGLDGDAIDVCAELDVRGAVARPDGALWLSEDTIRVIGERMAELRARGALP